jgi:hypothetical protein
MPITKVSKSWNHVKYMHSQMRKEFKLVFDVDAAF